MTARRIVMQDYYYISTGSNFAIDFSPYTSMDFPTKVHFEYKNSGNYDPNSPVKLIINGADINGSPQSETVALDFTNGNVSSVSTKEYGSIYSIKLNNYGGNVNQVLTGIFLDHNIALNTASPAPIDYLPVFWAKNGNGDTTEFMNVSLGAIPVGNEPNHVIQLVLDNVSGAKMIVNGKINGNVTSWQRTVPAGTETHYIAPDKLDEINSISLLGTAGNLGNWTLRIGRIVYDYNPALTEQEFIQSQTLKIVNFEEQHTLYLQNNTMPALKEDTMMRVDYVDIDPLVAGSSIIPFISQQNRNGYDTDVTLSVEMANGGSMGLGHSLLYRESDVMQITSCVGMYMTIQNVDPMGDYGQVNLNYSLLNPNYQGGGGGGTSNAGKWIHDLVHSNKYAPIFEDKDGLYICAEWLTVDNNTTIHDIVKKYLYESGLGVKFQKDEIDNNPNFEIVDLH